MTTSGRPQDRPEALPDIVGTSLEESLTERPETPEDAPKGLPGDDERDDLPFAFNEAYFYGRGDDDRLVSDISERYPDGSSEDVGDDKPGSEIATTDVKLTDTPISRSGRANLLIRCGRPRRIWPARSFRLRE